MLFRSPNNSMIYPITQRSIKLDSFSNTSYTYRDRGNTSFSSSGNTTASAALSLPTAAPGTETFAYTGNPLSSILASTFDVIPTVNGYSTNNPGTITTYSNTTIIGSGTSFTTTYRAGDFIYANTNLRRIVSIANDTYLTVTSNTTFSGSGINHQEAFPAGLPISFVNRSNRSIVSTSNTVTLNLGTVVNATFGASVYYDLNRDRKSTRLNSSHSQQSRMPSSA